MSERIKLYLEDQGQDFLYFIIDGNTIVEAGPFQNSVWAGREVWPSTAKWRKGSRVDFPAQKGTREMRLNYPVIRVELSPPEKATRGRK